MNLHKKSALFLALATVGRGSCRAVLWATLRHRLARSLALPVLLLVLAGNARAQVNNGSDGHDGAFNPTANMVVNMANHPDGIYHYTSVNIPTNVKVTFIANANNTPVIWLVPDSCVLRGTVDLSGKDGTGGSSGGVGGIGGPGGFGGGTPLTSGQGPGGGTANGPFVGIGYPGNGFTYAIGSFASYGSKGSVASCQFYCCVQPGSVYGNSFLVPLMGGSGGGGSHNVPPWDYYAGGGGGGGAILIAAPNEIQIYGVVAAKGGVSEFLLGGGLNFGGAGSGGAVRLITVRLVGSGLIDVSGGSEAVPNYGSVGSTVLSGGSGRIRLDVLDNSFGGTLKGVTTQGFQPIIIPSAGQGAQLNIVSIGGMVLPGNPSSNPANPAAIIPANQSNPVSIVVGCSNLPLNMPIRVSVKPMSGSPVSAVGYNNTGTLANSTATVLVNMPRGGGLIYATTATSN